MPNIKHCPFCGAKEWLEHLHVIDVDNNKNCQVLCSFCDTRGPKAGDPEMAIQKWNRRESK